jgi:uncharacterized protein YbjT (DUF2867 family)
MRRVLLLGATGLVGSELLPMLLADDTVARVIVITRRPTNVRHVKLDERIFDLAEMDRHPTIFAADQIFCTLGTTIRNAGSQEQFRFVDHDLPLLAAKLGLEHGAHHYLIVSALGANAKSQVFYNRVKGETENDLIALGYRSLTIARPSLLLGPRKERRTGEEIGKLFGWLLPPKYRPIEAKAVAHALAESARKDEPGVHIIESREMRRSFRAA